MSKLEEVIREERTAVASYLRRAAKDHRGHALRLLADTSQNEPDARLWEARATGLESAAVAVLEGRHWR